MIILDFGSGNTHRNDWHYARRMMDELYAIDHKTHEVIIKWQLFMNAGDNIPLDRHIFKLAYHYALLLGYQTTASVFDEDSLQYLLRFEVPFIKIANNKATEHLIGDIPRRIPVIKSLQTGNDYNTIQLCCISKYPARMAEYEETFSEEWLKEGISDHTVDWLLYKKYKPRYYEKHFVLEHDPRNLDGGFFSATPSQLKEIL